MSKKKIKFWIKIRFKKRSLNSKFKCDIGKVIESTNFYMNYRTKEIQKSRIYKKKRRKLHLLTLILRGVTF